jgi:hypothetical protein
LRSRTRSDGPSTGADAGEPIDPDGDRLTYVLQQAPAGMQIDSARRVTWDPATSGAHDVTLEV